jgi:excisionase family DNA binding protein
MTGRSRADAVVTTVEPARPTAASAFPNPGLLASPALWDVHDVARYLKVSVRWVYDRVQRGAMPHRRLGKHLRFDPEAVRRFALEDPTGPWDAARNSGIV